MKTGQQWKQYFETKEFREQYEKKQPNLGILYTKEKTIFTIWTPTAKEVFLCFYPYGSEQEDREKKGKLPHYVPEKIEMVQGENGVFSYDIEGDCHGIYYDFFINVDGVVRQTADPYAIACGVNGSRSMVVDMERLNPVGWEVDGKDFDREEKTKCPFLYEVHVKDFSFDPNSSIEQAYAGKYMAFTKNGTTYQGQGKYTTCMDYLKELGVTHVHLLPTYDFGSVDEKGDNFQFNWGYDPVNYLIPEGSYATDPYDGGKRITEFKEMVMAFHKAGIGVVLDMVLNHTYSVDSWLNRTVPYYYYRQWEDGELCNGSACGNDTASERFMMAEYMKKVVLHWAKEYHIDGFRFDLMGLHDTKVMNEIREELDRLPNGEHILMYGEPWTASQTNMEQGFIQATKDNISELNSRIAIFCDNTRDSIKGHVFYEEEAGFVNGKEGMEDLIKKSVLGWCHRENGWKAKTPSQIISYVSAHDNLTLWDKLCRTMGHTDFTSQNEDILAMNRLAAAIVFTCQGAVFMQAGEEFARTKLGDENSYSSSPLINQLDWTRRVEYQELVEYYKGLYQIRRNFPMFSWRNIDPTSYITFHDNVEKNVVAYRIKNDTNIGYEELFIVYNGREDEVKLSLPEGRFVLLANGISSWLEKEHQIVEQEINVTKKSAYILGKES